MTTKEDFERPYQLPAEGFVRLGQIIKPRGVLPIGRSRWFAGVASGEFPAAVKLGSISLWEARAIKALLDRVAAGHFAQTIKASDEGGELRLEPAPPSAKRAQTAGAVGTLAEQQQEVVGNPSRRARGK